MRFLIRVGAGLVALAGLGIAGAQAARVGCADWYARQATREALERSLEVAPEDASTHLQLALLLRDEGEAAAEIQFREAVEHNPWDSRGFIEWALLSEMQGDYDRAENLLLSAARVDTLYFPRWSLANYYLRRRDHANFWKWARSAAAMPPGNLHALYRLAVYMADGDDQSIAAHLDLHRPDTLRDYLAFAISAGRLSELKEISQQLRQPEDRQIVLRACDTLIRAGRNDVAVQMCPPSGALWRPSEGAFEWRVQHVNGIEATFLDNPKTLRLHLTANQPERCELLWRYLPDLRASDLSIFSTFYTQGLPADSGLHWELYDAVSGKPAGKLQQFLFADQWTTSRESVAVAKGTQGLRLSLVYQRALGTVRTEGDLYLKSVDVSGESQ